MAHPGTMWHAPVARRRLVRRPRLLGRLPVDAVQLPRVVLVCAPAGFGKTTVLAQWLEGWRADVREGPRRVAWLSLDAEDDDARRLLADLVAAIVATVPDAGAGAMQLLRSDVRATPEVVLGSVLADVAGLDGGLVLALDDYHLVRSAEAHRVVAVLLDQLPPGTGLALATRADPPLPLARLRARGELVELRAVDLRFTVAEATTFLNEAMGLSLEERQVEALEGRTEGWAAGLQLAALSLRGRAEPDAFIDRFTGSHRFVLDYLVEEVLDARDDTEQAFLRDTCVLDRMTGPLCDALTGRDDGHARLEALERANLFVVALDDTRTWYRYHHLFADALRARFAAADAERLRHLHRAAAGWYAAQGRPEAAIAHAVHGQDLGLAARLVEVALPEASRRRQDRTIRHWLGRLPDDEVRARPVLQVAAAWARLGDGDIDGADTRLLAAERLLDALPAHRRGEDDELRRLPMTIAMYRAATAQARHDHPGTARQARRILELAGPHDHLRRGAGHGFLGMSLWAGGDLPAAVDTFTACARSMRAAGNLTDELGCTVPLGLMWWARGRPDEARRLHEVALAEAARRPSVALPVLADLHVGLAAALVESGDLDEAADHLATARDLGDGASLPENRHRRPLVSARLAQARGDLDAAATLLRQAETLYMPGFFPDLRPIPALQARVDVARGRLDLAADWARRTDVPALALTYPAECDHLTYVRVLLAQEETAEASSRLARLLAAAERAGRAGSVIEILTLDALVAHRSGAVDLAVDRVGRALDLAVPAGYARLFLDEGPAMIELIGVARRRGRAIELPPVLARAGLSTPAGTAVAETAPVGTAPVGTAPAGTAVATDQPLSGRELEVLQLLATELTGPQIAGRLFVSVNTLRTHTRHIFTKLDVTTRAAAVRRGRDLRLL